MDSTRVKDGVLAPSLNKKTIRLAGGGRENCGPTSHLAHDLISTDKSCTIDHTIRKE